MDIKSPEERSINMSHIRYKNTKPEIIFRKWLFADGFRYGLGNNTIPGHPDLWMPKYRTAVFIHGCFWHRHPECKYAYTPKSRIDFWQKKFDNNVKRDQQVLAELREKKIRCLIIWECSIKKMLKSEDYCSQKMKEAEAFLQSDDTFLEL